MTSHRERLDALVGEWRADLAAADDAVRVLRESRGDDGIDDEHDPEGSTLSLDWSRAVAIVEMVTTNLADAEAALARLDDGTYGICRSCGRAIPEGRLEARPTSDLCVECSAGVTPRR